MNILNLYSGIGGNRKLWGNEHEITAVEYDPAIAEIYSENFISDTVIVGDAHEYLLNNFKAFDFIWTSPPCQSHTRLNTASFPSGSKEYVFPDLKLYEEIIFLKQWFKGKYVVENVIPYYKPLMPGEEVDRHLFWANFKIGNYIVKNKKKSHEKAQVPYLEKYLGYNLDSYKGNNKRQILRNCVLPETGKYILDRAMDIINKSNTEQTELFTNSSG
jgi:DNA (cytosine-5)-methyltransferase 1